MRFIVFGVTYLFFATHLLMCINYFWDKSKYPRIIWMRKSVTYSCFFYLVLCQRTEEKAALLSGTINPFSQWPKIASRVDLTRVPSPVLLHISNVSVCLDSYKRARRSLELIFKLYYFFFLFRSGLVDLDNGFFCVTGWDSHHFEISIWESCKSHPYPIARPPAQVLNMIF